MNYEAPQVTEVGSVEDLTLGTWQFNSREDNITWAGWKLTIPFGGVGSR